MMSGAKEKEAAQKEAEWSKYIATHDETKASSPDNSDAVAELDALIGLTQVKQEVRKLIDLVALQQRRRSKGMPDLSFSHHLVFTGNPGTGKTTVARIVGRIYQDLGVLKRGHMVETDRGGMVGGYTGQTAIKTQEVINKALDGVLFIDEAYALAPEGVAYGEKKGDSFGQEAVSTLLKAMEDNRDRLAVIVAGYKDEMNRLIASNPGLKSRFKTIIEFPDYNASDLRKIFEKMAGDAGCRLSYDGQRALARCTDTMAARAGKGFGNGRDVRNLFEDVIGRMARRLAQNPQADIAIIEASDIGDEPALGPDIDADQVLARLDLKKKGGGAAKAPPRKS